VKELYICSALSQELSSVLQLDDVGLDPGLLPRLQVLSYGLKNEHAENLFSSFVDARQVMGRPVLLSKLEPSRCWPCQGAFPFHFHIVLVLVPLIYRLCALYSLSLSWSTEGSYAFFGNNSVPDDY